MRTAFWLTLLAALSLGLVATAEGLRDAWPPVAPKGSPHGRVWGGQGGIPFADTLPESEQLTQIRIRSGIYIDAVQLTWGKVVGPRRGGKGGREHVITLRRGEYVEAISGRRATYVDAITIHTNQRSYGPFGGKGGLPFASTRRPATRSRACAAPRRATWTAWASSSASGEGGGDPLSYA